MYYVGKGEVLTNGGFNTFVLKIQEMLILCPHKKVLQRNPTIELVKKKKKGAKIKHLYFCSVKKGKLQNI